MQGGSGAKVFRPASCIRAATLRLRTAWRSARSSHLAALSAIAPFVAVLILFNQVTAWADSSLQIIDTHSHLIRSLGGGGRSLGSGTRRNSAGEDIQAVASSALSAMDQYGVSLEILSPPPFPPDRGGAYGLWELQRIARTHPGRFAFTAGGESLNPMIQETVPDRVTSEVRQRFERVAEAIAKSGAAGFGELAAEHFSAVKFHQRHPYESTPPDHPLLLELADIAARYDMPIELHMEAVPQDMPFPNPALMGPPNPPVLKANIAAFERLLDHNPKARIVWIHAGWDWSGERTVPLMRGLLERHPNLYMSVTHGRRLGARKTSPFRPDGSLKPGWLAMLRAFPDRFMVGSDQFFDQGSGRLSQVRRFVDALPPELARRIASENAAHVYRLPVASAR